MSTNRGAMVPFVPSPSTSSSSHSPSGENRIILIIRDADGQNQVKVNVKKSVPFKVVMERFTEKLDISGQQLRFLYDEKGINKNQTPVMLEMEDNDIIEVHSKQDGGFFGRVGT